MAVIFSGLTPYEHAIIEPTLHFLFNKNNCATRVEASLKNGMSIEDANKTRANCKSVSVRAETEDYRYIHCFCTLADTSLTTLVTCACALKNGILPFEGGYFDQPANIMEAIGIVSTFLNELEAKEAKKQQTASKRRGK